MNMFYPTINQTVIIDNYLELLNYGYNQLNSSFNILKQNTPDSNIDFSTYEKSIIIPTLNSVANPILSNAFWYNGMYPDNSRPVDDFNNMFSIKYTTSHPSDYIIAQNVTAYTNIKNLYDLYPNLVDAGVILLTNRKYSSWKGLDPKLYDDIISGLNNYYN